MKLPEKKVKQLIALMNSTSEVKIPPMKPILECFDMAMDEQMLDYLLTVGTKLHTLDELKAIYGRMYATGLENYDEQWNAFWAKIFEMSFVIPSEDRSKYILASIFPGWIEMSVSGPLNEKRRAILNRFMDFWSILKKLNIPPVRMLTNYKGMKERDTTLPHMSTYVSRGSREISLNQPLTSEHQVRVLGEIFPLLLQHKDEIAVMNCFCRQYKQMNGGDKCAYGLPVEGCVTIGAVSTQLVENGVARRLSYEEACDLMEEFERKGCIHTTYHYGGSADRDEIAICNCCPDCCLLYGGYQDGYLSKIFIKSFYRPEVEDLTRCTGCNKCGRHCPTNATYYDKTTGKLVFNYDNCVGCGQCVTQCAFDVRKLVRDERSVFVKTKKR